MDEIFSSDEENVSSAAAVAMLNETEEEEAIELDDDDLEGLSENQQMLEPQVILEGEELCHFCQGPLSAHYEGRPCEAVDESSFQSGHFLFDDSNESFQNGDGSHGKCIICSKPNTNKLHLATHFMKELIANLKGQNQCYKCDFQAAGTSSGGGSSSVAIAKKLANHDVTDHGGQDLDRLLHDAQLFAAKKAEFDTKNRTAIGKTCPICDQTLHKSHSRDHVAWHFMEELREEIPDPPHCPLCTYKGEKLEAISRHLALYHCKLDEFLENEQLVAAKRMKCLSKPKKVKKKFFKYFM